MPMRPFSWGAIMRLFAIAAAGILLMSQTAFASDASDVAATVQKYDDAFNKGDGASANALCTNDALILDDFAPHIWQGQKACSAWWDALGAHDQAEGNTGDIVKLGKPLHLSVTGDRAYAVYPTRYTYKKKGKPVLEHGEWTLVLQRSAGSWRIAGWAWAMQE